jgi:hypothetical protein
MTKNYNQNLVTNISWARYREGIYVEITEAEKTKFTLEQATKAQKGSRELTLLFLKLPP